MNDAETSSTHRRISAGRARHTLGTLLFATAICGGMLVVRFLYAGQLRFSYLFGNLLLAWIPMVLALFLWRTPQGGSRVRFWSTLVLWILFFPNTFYIVTDLVHFNRFGAGSVFWFDLLMTTSFACGGMFLGCLSLYLMHLFVRERFGWRLGWLFAGTMLALGSFGIYLGRELRFNSWDVFQRPAKLVGDLAGLLEPQNAKEVAAFSVTFFLFSLAIYVFVVSIARLHEGESAESPGRGDPI